MSIESIRWSAVVEKSTSNGFWQYRLSNNGKPAGVMTGFTTKGEAQYAATRMTARMNTIN